jgi:hypothetical protein
VQLAQHGIVEAVREQGIDLSRSHTLGG